MKEVERKLEKHRELKVRESIPNECAFTIAKPYENNVGIERQLENKTDTKSTKLERNRLNL